MISKGYLSGRFECLGGGGNCHKASRNHQVSSLCVKDWPKIEEHGIIPAASIAANSFLADCSLTANSRQALANTSGLRWIRTVWWTECFGSVVKKTTSGYLDRRSRNSGV